jgi:hypothetical protein
MKWDRPTEILRVGDGPRCVSDLTIGWIISCRCACGRWTTLDRDYLGRRGGYDTPWAALAARLVCRDYRCRRVGQVKLYLEKIRR